MRADRSLPIPLYHQIFVDLRDGIAAGRFSKGSFVPSEQELSKSYGVSRITAKRALDELEAARLVVREQGRGTVVLHDVKQRAVHGSVEGLVRDQRRNESIVIKLLEFGRVPAPPDVARALKLDEGADVHCVRRVLTGSGGPSSYLTTYVVTELAKNWGRRDLLEDSLTSLLEETGIRIAHSEELISAVAATKEVAAILQVKMRSPLLKIVRTVHDQSGRPVEHLNGLYPSDRYDYRVVLDR